MKKLVCSVLACGLALAIPSAAYSKAAGYPAAAPWPQGVMSVEGFPVARAEHLFKQTFSAIVNKYVKPASVTELSLAALAGLADIDQNLTVYEDGSRIALYYDGAFIKSFAKPENDISAEWVRVLVSTIVSARRVSHIVHNRDAEDLYDVMINAALSQLDSHSHYARPVNATRNKAARAGFGGIGLRYRRRGDAIEITRVVKKTPADKAGLKPGQLITHLNDAPLKNLTRQELIDTLRGPVSSRVSLMVMQPDKPETLHSVALKRALIVPETVRVTVKNDIAHITVSGFNQNTARSIEKHVLTNYEKNPELKGGVLDLRGNPGGLLDQAVAVSDLFLQDGLIVSTQGRHPLSMQSYDATQGDILDGLPLVVMVDGKAASSAEIVAAALQDQGRAVVIGTNTYGKGSVQTVVHLPNRAEMTLTWSHFHAPSGYSLNQLGVLPTLCTSLFKPPPAVNPLADDYNPEETKFADVVLTHLANHSASLSVNINSWRDSTVQMGDITRDELRNICPGKLHANAVVESILAEKLILKENAYLSAIATTVPSAAAAN